jgi:cysteine desulfurase / selenocysteine lyase
MEHHANIVPWQMIARRTGAVIKVIPVTDSGDLDMEAYRNLLSSRTKMVAVVHVSNALGTVNPVKEITELAHEHGAAVLIDGAQSIPHTPINVQEIGCDFFAFSAHKMCGPTGFGILYGKKELLDEMPPYRGGGDMIDKVSFEETTYNVPPFRFEAGTPPIAAGIGLGTAIDYLNQIGMDQIARREDELVSYATEQVV